MKEQDKRIEAAKAELNSYNDLYLKTENLKVDLQELKSRMSTLRVTKYDDQPRGGGPSYYLEECFDKLHDIEVKISENIWQMQQRQYELTERIHKLTGVFADILHKRYVERKSFEKISVEISYGYRQTKRLHRRALNVYAETFGL